MRNSSLKAFLTTADGRQPSCACCGKYMPANLLEVHHVLIHDQRKYHDQLTVPYNCTLVCHQCHQGGVVNGHEWRVYFLKCVIKAYGISAVSWWYEGLDMKLKLSPDNYWLRNDMRAANNADNMFRSAVRAGANKLN